MPHIPLLLLLSFSNLAFAGKSTSHKKEKAAAEAPEGSIWDTIEAAAPADPDAAPQPSADSDSGEEPAAAAAPASYPNPSEGNLFDFVEGGASDPDDNVNTKIGRAHV